MDEVNIVEWSPAMNRQGAKMKPVKVLPALNFQSTIFMYAYACLYLTIGIFTIPQHL